jgi:hypothetical protein
MEVVSTPLKTYLRNDLTNSFATRMTKIFGRPIQDADDFLDALNSDSVFSQVFEVAN